MQRATASNSGNRTETGVEELLPVCACVPLEDFEVCDADGVCVTLGELWIGTEVGVCDTLDAGLPDAVGLAVATWVREVVDVAGDGT